MFDDNTTGGSPIATSDPGGKTDSSTESSVDSNELSRLRTELDKLRNESASYRTQRNASLRREAALAQVVKAHNINFELDSVDLNVFKITNGVAEGELDYSPAKVEPKQPDVAGQGSPGLTMDDIAKMSEKEINANWEQVSQVLSAQ